MKHITIAKRGGEGKGGGEESGNQNGHEAKYDYELQTLLFWPNSSQFFQTGGPLHFYTPNGLFPGCKL